MKNTISPCCYDIDKNYFIQVISGSGRWRCTCGSVREWRIVENEEAAERYRQNIKDAIRGV